jgi:hypothetical protein
VETRQRQFALRYGADHERERLMMYTAAKLPWVQRDADSFKVREDERTASPTTDATPCVGDRSGPP